MQLDKLNRLVGFTGTENSCLPAGIYEGKQFSGRESNASTNFTLSGHSLYIDSDISEELRNKVTFIRIDSIFLHIWFSRLFICFYL